MKKDTSKETQETNLSKILLVFLAVLVVFLSGFYLGRVDPNTILRRGGDDSVLLNQFAQSPDGTDVRLLWDVWAKVQAEYIESDSVDNQEALYGAIKGMVDSLGDDYTKYFTPEENKELKSLAKGEFQGIGTTLTEEEGYVIVESPVLGSPAERAGLEPNDKILEVDGEDVVGVSVYEVAAKIRGDAGTEVELLVLKDSDSTEVRVDIVREVIDIDNISVKDRGEGIVEISIVRFTEDSVLEFNQIWDKKIEEVLELNPKGVIVDLRNNPGGFVLSVEYALAEFLPKGTPLFIEEVSDGKRTTFKSDRTGTLTDIPLVVLVNGGSASASEIFAGAISDNDRGLVVGTPTTGKGVVQKLVEFNDGSMLQLVFKKWLTPDGVNISKDSPITPDEEIEDFREQDSRAYEYLRNLSESDF